MQNATQQRIKIRIQKHQRPANIPITNSTIRYDRNVVKITNLIHNSHGDITDMMFPISVFFSFSLLLLLFIAQKVIEKKLLDK